MIAATAMADFERPKIASGFLRASQNFVDPSGIGLFKATYDADITPVTCHFILDRAPTVKVPPTFSLSTALIKLLDLSHIKEENELFSRMHRNTRLYVLEDRPAEISRVVHDLLDPRSATSMHLLPSFMSMLMANDLVSEWRIQEFVEGLDESVLCLYLKPLLRQLLPSNIAVASRILHVAARVGAINVLQYALKAGIGVDLKSSGYNTYTLLQRALEHDQVTVAELLLDGGADVQVSSAEKFEDRGESTCSENDGEDILCTCQRFGHYAPICLAARSSKCCELIPTILENGAILPKAPVLTWAILSDASLYVVKCLIRAGSNLKLCAYDDNDIFDEATPLSAAASRGNVEVTALLLKEGADPNGAHKSRIRHMSAMEACFYDDHEDTYGTPLFAAMSNAVPRFNEGHSKVAQMLLEHGADPNLSKFESLSGGDAEISSREIAEFVDAEYWEFRPRQSYPLQAAVMSGDTDAVNMLLQYGASTSPRYGSSLLTLAVYESHTHLLDTLIRHGVSLDDPGLQRGRCSPLVSAILDQEVHLVDLLLNAGASVNPILAMGEKISPLQAAAMVGNRDIIERLLRYGASLTVEVEGKDSLMLQAFTAHRHHDYLARALHAGAQSNSYAPDEPSALNAAVLQRDPISLRLLLDAGANLHAYAWASRRSRGNLGSWFQDWTADESCLGVSRLLGLDGVGKILLSPVQWAAAIGSLEIAEFLCNEGADIGQAASPESGMMALQIAVYKSQMAMVEYLLDKGADVNVRSETGFACDRLHRRASTTAIGNAVMSENINMVQLLLDKGADVNVRSETRFPFDSGWQSVPHHRDSTTALGVAVMSKDIGIVQLLLDHGADPNATIWQHHEKLQPLDYACRNLMFDVVHALLTAGADLKRGNPLRSTLSTRAKSGKDEVFELLLSWGAVITDLSEEEDTLLQTAIREDAFTIANRLIDAGVSVNEHAKDSHGRTALQAASEVGNLDLIEHLIGLGANVNAPPANSYGVTALQAAAIKGYLKIAQV